jgi:hypothetical protein
VATRKKRTGAQRRVSPRVKVDLPARIEIRTKSGKLHDVGEGRVRTINLGGLLVTDLKFKKRSLPLEPFTLHVGVERPPDGGPTIRIWCEPVNLRHQKKLELGARFIKLSRASKARLTKFLAG